MIKNYMDYIIILFLGIILYKSKLFKKNCEYLNIENSMCVKGVFAIVVVIHHISQRIPGKEGLVSHFLTMGYLAVGIFFFLSGYGIMTGYINSGNEYIKSFWRRRGSKVLVPSILAILVYLFVNIVKTDVNSIMLKFKGIRYGETFVPNTWYIVVILLFYCIFYCSIKLSKGNKTVIIISNIVGVIIFILFCIMVKWGIYWYNSVLCFPLGIFWSAKKEKIDGFLQKKYWLKLVVIAFSYNLSEKCLNNFNYNVVCYNITVMLFCALIFCFLMKNTFNNRLLRFLGLISFEIYIYQGLFIDIDGILDHFALLLFAILFFAYTMNVIDGHLINILKKYK